MLEATAHDSQGFTALAKRNCSIAPVAFCIGTGALVATAVLIATAWAVAGAWLVLPFAGLEGLALVAAVVCLGRHAGDFERICLTGDRLVVEVQELKALRRYEFNPAWVRIVVSDEGRGRLAVRYHGRELQIGRHLAEGERRRLVQELLSRLPSARA